ncbi:four helix bundle protein [Flavobacterium sp.]|uniref:four helix bundle protein n=1 Tax=Flavobacterium sp. TaxID=239 RepID=UPI0034297AAC
MIVWNDAKEITKTIYQLTASFPSSEKFGLSAQLRRAAVSICSNIAEGSARSSYKDQAHFTNIAFGSTVEIVNQLILAFELNFLEESQYLDLRKSLLGLSNKLNSLRNTQLSRMSKTSSNQPINKSTHQP